MERFIRSDQYHYIKNQAHTLLNGHRTTNDAAVTQALISITYEKVLELFSELTLEQEQLITQVREVKDETEAILYFSRLKQYVIPFPKLSDEEIKHLFPKRKKLKIPALDEIDGTDVSYIGWNDPGANRKYIITHVNGELTGLSGYYKPLQQKSICAIWREHEKVGLFTTTLKGGDDVESISRGHYICHHSHKCNENIQSREHLDAFIHRMKY